MATTICATAIRSGQDSWRSPYDYQARVDWGERAAEVSARAARALVTAYCGRAPSYAYFDGCSNGGRQGMVFAERFPGFFDGIVATAPAFALPVPNFAGAWDTQVFAGLARTMGLREADGRPAVNRTFSDEDLALVADAIRQACDALDGVADGLVMDVMACDTARVRPVLEARRCVGADRTGCLLTVQITALLASYAGPHRGDGTPLYAEWPWDPGIGGRVGDRFVTGWRMAKLGSYGLEQPYPTAVTLIGPATAALSMTPPVVLPDDSRAFQQYLLDFDFDRDPPKALITTPEFPRSATALMGVREAQLTRFRERGGKLLIPHGVSDAIFSFHDTRRWWQALDDRLGGAAASFVRVYAVPGMGHCRGGSATDQFVCLEAVVQWVEQGTAPDFLLAQAGPRTPWPGRTRPLCAFPQVARYIGKGSLERAESFVYAPTRPGPARALVQ